MKHYVVVLNQCTEDGNSVELLGVTHTMEDAKNIFQKAAAEQKEIAAENSYTIEENSDTYFEAGLEGWYSTNSITLFIAEV